MRIIVIGNGMVGYKFCEKLRRKQVPADVIVYGEELRPAYDRVHLSSYFSGKSEIDLQLAPLTWYKDNNVILNLGEMVTSIDRHQRTIRTHTGKIDHYDYLVLATGSSPFVPAISGIERDGVFVYRTIEDLNQIMTYSRKAKRGAVLGGGLLGLEAAKALIDLGLDTHVIEFASRLMPRQLDNSGSSILRGKLEKMGIHVHLNKTTQSITGNGRLHGIEFGDGSRLDIDMLVISAGIRPRDEVAKVSGISVHARGGVIVDHDLRTNDDRIFAIGEVAVYNNMIYGLIAPGYEMSDVVVAQLSGDRKTFTGYDMSTKLKLLGVDVASFGDALGETEGCVPITFEDKHNGIYKRINISADGKHLLGGILVGDASRYNVFHQMVLNRLTLPTDPSSLIAGAPDKEGVGDGVNSLPAEAQICSCENISKAQLTDVIVNNGCTTLDSIKKSTKACTGCGGCTPMVTDILKHTLESLGHSVKKSLCEHFEYSRQELFDLIKVKGIRTFNEMIDLHGKGDGCEICKPAVASLLASIWNEPIVALPTIQDTNDRFLANIQKGGTYSVVPRIPGGEITPAKLIAIGRIAQKYDLYTKITGGQRIDMFGARINQLPQIWEELISEGFESGHAYGKSLRTVKSCVGSTWCRYGVQDSVSFAIYIEERYKGLRAPHKLKGAVSGCIRECAEAQSKDFGIIATEKGWNLYVCGNGGSRPQHAKLLVADVSTETCVKLIDRFLMFYIRTADPLTRTATWLNKMDGGLKYLHEVIVEDSLGIGEDLEAEMKDLLNHYECEWKKVVENPALRQQFRHFINAEEEDDSSAFVEARGQKFPADWNNIK